MTEEIRRASDVPGHSVVADLDLPEGDPAAVVVLAHGAGGSRGAANLLAVSAACTAIGIAVARIDLPYRQLRPKGPPTPSRSGVDRDGIRAAAAALRERLPDVPLAIGGHSYGGRQASMVAAEDPAGLDALILTSYPLHPPGKPERLRVEHLPDLTVPTVVAQGNRDPFGTAADVEAAFAVVPAPVTVLTIENAGHDLAPRKSGFAAIVAAALAKVLVS
ncbi:alpha/beta hydrolase family protein [Millisia brevis]|uniref:alpha/beta hydrolase family protein n=1 Tax=Millisia brevis TaxID=264148 RepID=UPI000B28B976|nr:alpha/beta fold hydrolase [Millisia brevis]